MDKRKITLFMENQDGSAQTWGYDYPQLIDDEHTKANMAGDFPTLPPNLKRDPIAKIMITVDYEDGSQKAGTFTVPDLAAEAFVDWVFDQIEGLEA